MARELPSSVAIKLYLCYVRPSLVYAAPVWHGSILENDAIKLERIQCSVARSLLKAEGNTQKETLLRSLNSITGLLCAGAVKSTPCYCFLTYWSDGQLLCLSVSSHSLAASRNAPSVDLTSFFFLMLIPINLSSLFSIDPLYCGTLCRTQCNLWQVKDNFVLPSKKNGEITSLIPSIPFPAFK